MQENTAYDWDSEINNEESEYVLLPEGDYEFTVEKFERAQFDGSAKVPPCKKAIVTFRIHGESDMVSIIENFLLYSGMEWKLSALFLSVGMKKHGEPLRMNRAALPGRTGRCHIFTDTYYSKDDLNKESPKKTNRIKKFYAYDDDVQVIRPAKQDNTSWKKGQF